MRIIPSILDADLANLTAEITRIPSADGIHIDVMDNDFVPNLTLGLPVVKCLRKSTTNMLDIHLMISEVDRWALAYAEAGAESVTFHVESSKAPIRLARQLRELGTRAAIALRPATPIEPYADLLDEIDMILLMTVEPGFGGQKFLDLVIPKIQRTKNLIANRPIWLQVDGGISLDTIGRCANAGADTFVAGSAVYGATDPDKMVNQLRKAALDAVNLASA